MATCPVCSTHANSQYSNTPYWMCPNCDLWFQDPLPAPGQRDAVIEGMSDYEKEINQSLAEAVLAKGRVGRVLDIGSNYPYLAHCFQKLGCEAMAMDRIEGMEKAVDELHVPFLQGDFECTKFVDASFEIITLIHSFNYMRDPLNVLRKLRRMLADDGIVQIRIPDHGVSGFEQHIGHPEAHPYIWSLPAILEVLVQLGDCFTIKTTGANEGAGQRDLTLKPLTKKPQLWCGMIVKNEERDLPKCLATIHDVVDGIVIVDTGSTDQTEEAARSIWQHMGNPDCNTPEAVKPFEYSVYTGASRKDESGDWKLWDFGKARNQFVTKIDAIPEADYMIWMDADDTLLTPNNLRRAIYMDEYEVFGLMIETDGLKWVHHRMWKTRIGIFFEGRIHEYPGHGGHPGITLKDNVIHHDAAPGVGENSNQRNLRILLEEFADNPTSTRTAFYLANTHKDGGRFAEAIEVYEKRIALGPGYWDECMFARLYKARCERAIGRLDEANKTLLAGLSEGANWSEFWMELAYIAYGRSEWQKCIGYCHEALSYPPSHTELWREHNKYTDQPARLLSFCYESLDDKPQALKWAEVAKQYIGGPDADWDERLLRLSNRPVPARPAQLANPSDLAASFLKKTGKKVKRIALHRPGAIGDIIMTLNLIPGLKKKYPGYEIHYFCHAGIGQGLDPLFKAAGVTAWHDFQTLKDCHKDYESVFNMVGYPIPPKGNYPEEPMKRHLLHYFAEEAGLIERPELPQLSCVGWPSLGLQDTSYCTIHPKAGWSMYKNWAFGRWEQVITACPEIKFVQIGAEGDYKLSGADHRFLGAPLIDSVSLLSNARMHVGIDSFTNHLTHIKWQGEQTPAIILWGSTQWQAAGYPENVNISLDLECQPCFREDPKISAQPRGACINPPGQVYENPCHACMTGIEVDRVIAEVKKMWSLQR